MNTPICISVRTEWRDADADESKCFACGDAIFMGMKQLFMGIGDSCMKPMDEYTLCQSCSDCLESESK